MQCMGACFPARLVVMDKLWQHLSHTNPDLDHFALSLGKSLLFATYPNLGENGGGVFILSASWGHLVDSLARQ